MTIKMEEHQLSDDVVPTIVLEFHRGSDGVRGCFIL